MEPPRSGALVLAWTGVGGGVGGALAATAPRLANVIWWGTGVTDRSVNAAIWFGLEQISDAFWGQNNPALPICGGKRTVRSTAKYFRSKKKRKKEMKREATGRGKKITWWWAAGKRN